MYLVHFRGYRRLTIWITLFYPFVRDRSFVRYHIIISLAQFEGTVEVEAKNLNPVKLVCGFSNYDERSWVLAVENNFTQTTEWRIGGWRSRRGLYLIFLCQEINKLLPEQAQSLQSMESWSEPWNQKLGLMVFFIFLSTVEMRSLSSRDQLCNSIHIPLDWFFFW